LFAEIARAASWAAEISSGSTAGRILPYGAGEKMDLALSRRMTTREFAIPIRSSSCGSTAGATLSSGAEQEAGGAAEIKSTAGFPLHR
jgi:hypothetical protein